MMNEKVMVNDILSNVKSSLTAYQTAITETENADPTPLKRHHC